MDVEAHHGCCPCQDKRDLCSFLGHCAGQGKGLKLQRSGQVLAEKEENYVFFFSGPLLKTNLHFLETGGSGRLPGLVFW